MSASSKYRLAPGWTPAVTVLFLLVASVLLSYRETATAMVAIWWRSETFTHAFTVPPIVAWLIWRQRHALAAQVPRSSPWTLLPIGVVGVLWLLGDLSATNAVTQLAFTALLVLVVVAVLGTAAARTIAFALAFLFFSVPIGEFVMPQMMQWTADFTVFALRLSGIPVFREGLQFVIPSGNWSVVEACSGIRYLIASVMVGVLFAYLNYRSLQRRLIFVGVAIVVPVIANWIRAYLIVLTGHLSGNKLAVGVDHLIYGWVFFGLIIFLMFMIGSRWSDIDVAAVNPPAAGAVPRAINVAPNRLLWAVSLGAVVLVLAPHIALKAVVRSEIEGTPALVAPVRLASGWQAAEPPAGYWKPSFQGAAAEFNRIYTSRDQGLGGDVGLYIGYYRHQNYERKLVSSDNSLVRSDDTAWALISADTRQVQRQVQGKTDVSPLAVRVAQLRGSAHVSQSSSTRLVAWQLYWVNGSLTASDQRARAYAAFYRLLGRGDDAAVIVVYAKVDAAGEMDNDGGKAVKDTDTLLESFMQTNLPQLERLLARTRDGE